MNNAEDRLHVAAERGTDGGANLRPDQGIVSMRRVLRLDVERAKVGLLLARCLKLLLGLRECHLHAAYVGIRMDGASCMNRPSETSALERTVPA